MASLEEEEKLLDEIAYQAWLMILDELVEERLIPIGLGGNYVNFVIYKIKERIQKKYGF